MRSPGHSSKKEIFSVLSLIVLIIIISGCRSSDSNIGSEGKANIADLGQETVLRVGPLDYSLTEVEWTFQELYSSVRGVQDVEKMLAATVHQLKGETFLYLEARNADILDKTAVELKEMVILPQYIGWYYLRHGRPGEPFVATDDEIALKEPETWEKMHVSQVVTSSRKSALEVKTLLEDGEDFTSIAKKYSIGPNANSGGVVSEIFVRGEAYLFSSDVHEELFRYQKQQISAPILTGMGWSVFRIDERYPVPQAEIQARRVAIRSNIGTEKMFIFRGEIEDAYQFIVFKDALKAALSDPERLGEVVVGQVGNISVTMGQLEFYAQWYKYDPQTEERWEDILLKMGNSLRFYADAVNTGGDQVPELVYSLNFFKRKILSDAYLEVLVGGIPITDEQLWDYYRENWLPASIPGKKPEGWFGIRALHAQTEGDANAAGREYHSSRSWSEVYSKYNTDKVAADGDLPVSITVSLMPWEMYDTLRNVKEGNLSRPLLRPDGKWALFLVEKRQVGREAEFDREMESVLLSFQEEKKEEIQIESLAKGESKYSTEIPGKSVLLQRIPEWVTLLEAEGRRSSGGGHGSGGAAPH